MPCPRSSCSTISPAAPDAKAPPLDVALGFYELHQNRLYNSALYATLGGPDAGIRHIHRKVFLPTYGVFDEERFVEAGRSVQAFDTRWGRAAILICEDAWHSFTPDARRARRRPAHHHPEREPGRGVVTQRGRRAAVRRAWPAGAGSSQDMAGEHGVYVALAQLVGFEGGKAFPGGSIVAGPRGDVLAEGPVFEEALVPAPLDFEEITRARTDFRCWPISEMRLPHLLGSLHAREAGGGAAGSGGSGQDDGAGPAEAAPGHARSTAPSPAAPLPPSASPLHPSQDPLEIDPELTRRWLRRVHPRRGPAPARVRAGRDRALRRRGQLAGGLPRGRGARRRRTSSGSGCRTGPRAPRAWSTPSW